MEEYVYNREMILKNIDLLMKERHVKSSVLEEQAGVSRGYLSRIKDSDSSLFVIFLMKVCNALNCTLDDLVRAPLGEMTKNERLLLNLVRSLNNRTTSQEIVWDGQDVAAYIESDKFDPAHFSYPLYFPEIHKMRDFIMYPSDYHYRAIIPIEGEETITQGNIFRTPLVTAGNQVLSEVYLAKVATEKHKDELNYEMFLVEWKLDPNGNLAPWINPLCSTRRCNLELKVAIFQLYDLITDSCNKIYIQAPAKDILSSFIKYGVLNKVPKSK